jgi:hypothetical protein
MSGRVNGQSQTMKNKIVSIRLRTIDMLCIPVIGKGMDHVAIGNNIILSLLPIWTRVSQCFHIV